MTKYLDYKEYEKKFKKRSTKHLLKEYKNFNSDFKKLARQELIKRGVFEKKIKNPQSYDQQFYNKICKLN